MPLNFSLLNCGYKNIKSKIKWICFSVCHFLNFSDDLIHFGYSIILAKLQLILQFIRYYYNLDEYKFLIIKNKQTNKQINNAVMGQALGYFGSNF